MQVEGWTFRCHPLISRGCGGEGTGQEAGGRNQHPWPMIYSIVLCNEASGETTEGVWRAVGLGNRTVHVCPRVWPPASRHQTLLCSDPDLPTSRFLWLPTRTTSQCESGEQSLSRVP